MKNKVRVPLMLNQLSRLSGAERQRVLSCLREAEADMVFLATAAPVPDRAAWQKEREALWENQRLFENAGFEVGVWIGHTIGHGGPLAGIETAAEAEGDEWTLWTDVDGRQVADNYCPLGPAFLDAVSGWARDLAAAGVKTILLDDDFRMTLRGEAPGCLCDRHMAAYCDAVGESLSREEIKEKALSGPAGRYRAAWMKVQGDALRTMAARIRAAVDEVDPTVRIGFCCNPSSFDTDGTNAPELSRILAGNTRPLVRLTGAPYWAYNDGAMLSYAIESSRLLQSYFDGTDAETFTELDSYPHSAFLNPASFMELVDLALIADGRAQGSLKYLFRYGSKIDREPAYLAAHRRNRDLRSAVQRHFDGKRPVGLNIFEPMSLLEYTDLPVPYAGFSGVIGALRLPTPAQKWMRDLSLPLVYGNPDAVNVVFGEAAAYVTPAMLRGGMILNMRAARILHDRGVDVGYTDSVYVGTPQKEHDLETGEDVLINTAEFGVYALSHRSGVRVLSTFSVNGCELPGLYEYENAEGGRFLVWPFWEYNPPEPDTSYSGYVNETLFGNRNNSLVNSYIRQRQVAKSVDWLGRKPFPVTCPGHPYLWLLAKEDEASLSVALGNFSMDPVIRPVLTLAETYARCESVGAAAAITDKELHFTENLPPMSLTVVTLYR